MNNFGEDRFGILIAISDASTETGDVGGVRECLTANVVDVVMPALCNAARTLQITSADLPESVDMKILSDGRGKACAHVARSAAGPTLLLAMTRTSVHSR
jgi:hypothetical protein